MVQTPLHKSKMGKKTLEIPHSTTEIYNWSTRVSFMLQPECFIVTVDKQVIYLYLKLTQNLECCPVSDWNV